MVGVTEGLYTEAPSLKNETIVKCNHVKHKAWLTRGAGHGHSLQIKCTAVVLL